MFKTLYIFSLSFSNLGSLSSSLSTSSFLELPNLPGVKRDVASVNPKLYREYKASKSRGSLLEEDSLSLNEDNSLLSYFEDSSKFDFSRVVTPFPSDGHAFNDLSGRYSIVSQRKDRDSKTRPLPYSSTESLPPFVSKSASRVCSFVAYFTEPETKVTEERGRKVIIKYYLEDDTIEINEPRIENSGVLQGKFLKRHRIPKMNSQSQKTQYYTLDDFYAGAQVIIYTRAYTVVDCDRATKMYFDDVGKDFGRPLPLPDCIYDPRTRAGNRRSPSRCSSTHESKRRSGFFEYDRKVLRFFGVWDSSSSLFGDAIKVKLHYTLADDMIDIVSVSEKNSGRDSTSTLLKKSKIYKRRPGTSGNTVKTSNLSDIPAGDPYHWRDLRIGETIYVASMEILLTDADEFTREFYNTKSMPLGPPIELPEPVYPTVTTEIPPYNGFGSKEDSLQTCKSNLVPSAPMKDGMKAQLFQGMVLRYRAKLHNPKEADKSREFIIQYHLEDDSVQIREPPIRNTGHKGGIFLARCQVDAPELSDETKEGGSVSSVNTKDHANLSAYDIFIGATITILSHKFDILDCDQYTFKYMEANPRLWNTCDLSTINRKLITKKDVVKHLILTSPGLGNRSINVDELEELLIKAGIELIKQEVCTLYRSIDLYQTGSIKLTKVLRYFMDL